MNFVENQTSLIESFNLLTDWQARFQYLIEIGQTLPAFPEHLKTPENRIAGCQSKTFIHVSLISGNVLISGWSNASIPAGFIAVLKQLCDGFSAGEIAGNIRFHLETGLLENLSFTRQNSLTEMITRIESSVFSPL
jgi:cysteine desulfuration protein SufE